MPRHSPFRIELTRDERRELEARARRYTSPYREVLRAKLVLLAADGLSKDLIAARLDTPRQFFNDARFRGLLCELLRSSERLSSLDISTTWPRFTAAAIAVEITDLPIWRGPYSTVTIPIGIVNGLRHK